MKKIRYTFYTNCISIFSLQKYILSSQDEKSMKEGKN